MKGLVEYIKEACEEKTPASKSFSFNLNGLENVDEVIKSAQEMIESNELDATVEEQTITIKVKKDNPEKSQALFDLVSDFISKRSSDIKNSSDMAYAEKVKNLSDKVSEYTDYISCTEEPEEEPKKEDEKKDDKKEDEKKDDKKEDEE